MHQRAIVCAGSSDLIVVHGKVRVEFAGKAGEQSRGSGVQSGARSVRGYLHHAEIIGRVVVHFAQPSPRSGDQHHPASQRRRGNRQVDLFNEWKDWLEVDRPADIHRYIASSAFTGADVCHPSSCFADP
jgi:hypothetical protein